MKEEWRAVTVEPFTEFYEVSSTGVVRSKDRDTRYLNGLRRRKGMILKTSVSYNGYERVMLCNGPDNDKILSVHRLVALSFVENKDGKPCINHIDGDKGNNQSYNLEWCTYSENTRHGIRNGLMNFSVGEKHGNSKLTNADVLHIRQIYIPRVVTNKMIAAKYGVSVACIESVIKRETWTHI